MVSTPYERALVEAFWLLPRRERMRYFRKWWFEDLKRGQVSVSRPPPRV